MFALFGTAVGPVEGCWNRCLMPVEDLVEALNTRMTLLALQVAPLVVEEFAVDLPGVGRQPKMVFRR